MAVADIRNWLRRLLAHNGVALAVVALALYWGGEQFSGWFNHPITLAIAALIPLALIIAYAPVLLPKPRGLDPERPPPPEPPASGLTAPTALKALAAAVALGALLPFLRYSLRFFSTEPDPWPHLIDSSPDYSLFAAFILTAFTLLVANYRPGPAFLPAPVPPILAAAIILAVGLAYPITGWHHPCYATFIGCLAVAAILAQRPARPALRPNS